MVVVYRQFKYPVQAVVAYIGTQVSNRRTQRPALSRACSESTSPLYQRLSWSLLTANRSVSVGILALSWRFPRVLFW